MRSRESYNTGISLIVEVVLLLLVFVGPSVLPVFASQNTFVIPFEGGRWRRYTIPVFIPATPSWAHNVTLRAMNHWNEAQAWFANTYYPQNPYFTLVEGDNNSKVQVQLSDTPSTDYTTYEIVPRPQKDNATIVSAVVHVCTRLDKILFHEVAMHELGHVLGLGHVKCCIQEDLMYPIANPYAARQYFPSTLDLYALHVLATERTIPNSVTLPIDIQYLTAPDQIFARSAVSPFVEASKSADVPTISVARGARSAPV